MRRLVLLLLAFAAPAAALDDRDAAKLVAVAEGDGARSLTAFVDVTWGARKDRAAAQLSAAHRAFGRQGWDAVDVEGYSENGDLQGFFVTYVKRGR